MALEKFLLARNKILVFVETRGEITPCPRGVAENAEGGYSQETSPNQAKRKDKREYIHDQGSQSNSLPSHWGFQEKIFIPEMASTARISGQSPLSK